MKDTINPSHYKSHPSGVECIQITEHLSFCLGNALKYIWRAGLKSENVCEDLEKAKWYIDREIKKQSISQEASKTAASVPTQELFEYAAQRERVPPPPSSFYEDQGGD